MQERAFEKVRGPCPFPGAAAYGYDDSWAYSGQSADELLSELLIHHIVVLHARAGAGKSSLLAAEFRKACEARGFQSLETVSFRETRAGQDAGGFVATTLSAWSNQRTEPPHGRLKDYFRSLPPPVRDEQKILRIAVIDHVESIFLPPATAEQRHEFFSQLIEMLRLEPSVRIVLAVRKEYFRDLDEILKAECTVNVSDVLLRPFTGAQAGQAIQDAFAKSNLAIATNTVDWMLGCLQRSASARNQNRAVELDQLQVLCQYLWQHAPEGAGDLSPRDAKRILADVDGILALHCGRAIRAVAGEVGIDARKLGSAIERHLVVDGASVELPERDERKDLPNRALQRLSDYRVLRERRRGGKRFYQLNGDALARPLVIAAQRRQILQSLQVDRRRRLLSLGGLVLLCIAYVWLSIDGHRQGAWASYSDQALAQLFWGEPGEAGLERIKRVLQRRGRQNALPSNHHQAGRPCTDQLGELCLGHASRALDRAEFARQWAAKARTLNLRGYDLPEDVHFREEERPTSHFSLESVDAEFGTVRVDLHAQLPRTRVLVDWHPDQLVQIEGASKLPTLAGVDYAAVAPWALPLVRHYDEPWSRPLSAPRSALSRPEPSFTYDSRARAPEVLLVELLYQAALRDAPELLVNESHLPRMAAFWHARSVPHDAEGERFLDRLRACPRAFAEAAATRARGLDALPDARTLLDEVRARQDAAAPSCPAESASRMALDPMGAAAKRAPSIRLLIGAELFDLVVKDGLTETVDELMERLRARTGLPVTVEFERSRNVDPRTWMARLGDATDQDLSVDASRGARVGDVDAERLDKDRFREDVLQLARMAPARLVDLRIVQTLLSGLPASFQQELRRVDASALVVLARQVVEPSGPAPKNCPWATDPNPGTWVDAPRMLRTAALMFRHSQDVGCIAGGLRTLDLAEGKAAPSTAFEDALTLLDTDAPQKAFAALGEVRSERGTEFWSDLFSAQAHRREEEEQAGASILLAQCTLASQSAFEGLSPRDRQQARILLARGDLSKASQRKLDLCLAGSLARDLSSPHAAEGLLPATVANPSHEERLFLAFWQLDALVRGSQRDPAQPIDEQRDPAQSVDESRRAGWAFTYSSPDLDVTRRINALRQTLLDLAASLPAAVRDSYLVDATKGCQSLGIVSVPCWTFIRAASEMVSDPQFSARLAIDFSAFVYDEDSTQIASHFFAQAAAAGPQTSGVEMARRQLARAPSDQRSEIREEQTEAFALAERSPEPMKRLAWAQEAMQWARLTESPTTVQAAQARFDALTARMNVEARDEATIALQRYSEAFQTALWVGDHQAARDILEPALQVAPDENWEVLSAMAFAMLDGSETVAGLAKKVGASSVYPVHARILAAAGRALDRHYAQNELSYLRQAFDSERWSERLAEHDYTVWWELLMADFIEDGSADELLSELERDPKSPLLALGMNPKQLRCELAFYRALRFRLEPRDEGQLCLQIREVLKTGVATYYEYAMARFLALQSKDEVCRAAIGQAEGKN